VNFKIKKSLHHHFLVKNGNFKTRDFSPLIESVLAGVYSSAGKEAMFRAENRRKQGSEQSIEAGI
jgi:hypothetical protein